MSTFVYGLVDPMTQQIRYVGQTSVGMSRPKSGRYNGHCKNWIKSIYPHKPEIIILEVWNGIDDEKQWLNETEIFYIAYFKMVGAKLTNMTDGGDGVSRGNFVSLETRKKMSRARRGVPRSQQVKDKCKTAADRQWERWRQGDKNAIGKRTDVKRKIADLSSKFKWMKFQNS